MSARGRAPLQDLTARARIRDAAIRLFARLGIADTSVKAIADAAGVSAPLVIHHFGSKEGLRTECDRHVNALIWEMKAHLGDGLGQDPLAALREARGELPLLEYLANALQGDSPHVDALVDSMVEDTLKALAAAEASGLVRAGDYRRERAVVLVLWQLGALVLHRQARRLLGADLTGPSSATLNWWLPAADILANGVIDPAMYRGLRQAAVDASAAATAGEGEIR